MKIPMNVQALAMVLSRTAESSGEVKRDMFLTMNREAILFVFTTVRSLRDCGVSSGVISVPTTGFGVVEDFDGVVVAPMRENRHHIIPTGMDGALSGNSIFEVRVNFRSNAWSVEVSMVDENEYRTGILPFFKAPNESEGFMSLETHYMDMVFPK